MPGPTGVKPPLPADTMRVAFEGTFGPATWAVVQYFALASTGDPTLAQLNTLVDAVGAAFGTNLIHLTGVSNQVHFTTIKATYRLQSGTGSYKTRRVADVTGNGSGDYDPAQVSFLYNWITIDDRRGGKCRSYIPGVVDGARADEVFLSGGTVTSLAGHAADYLTAIAAITSGPLTGLQMVEMSFVDGGAYRGAAVFFPVVAAAPSPAVATQRRRVDRLRS